MTNTAYIATSLDGYIAAADGGIDWLIAVPNPEGSDYGFAEFMSRIDALVMGRNTFEKVLTFSEWVYEKPVFVLSNTLKNVPEHLADKAFIVSGDLNELVETLNAKGYKNLYIDGGKTIQSFLQLDRIDELIITTIPVLLGRGISLFGDLPAALSFEHKETTVHSGQLVMSRYTRTGVL